MVRKQQYTSPESLLIHPGETLEEIIVDRKINQKELAIRTGFSEKHISTVISGTKGISAEFAKRLEYALNIPASFWRNLQSNYDLEVVEQNEKSNITKNEISVAKEVKPIIEAFFTLDYKNDYELVTSVRKIACFSSLEALDNLKIPLYRAGISETTSKSKIYMWQILCEKAVEPQEIMPLDINKLRTALPKIRAVMHKPLDEHVQNIQKILNDCGVYFLYKEKVKSVPINGFVVKTNNNQPVIVLTNRHKYVDSFWFTLFHEIAHVINNDYSRIIKTKAEVDILEEKADLFARNILIPNDKYQAFVKQRQFSSQGIEKFAAEVGVLKTIVSGRLMKDGLISYKFNTNLRIQYPSKEDKLS